MLPRLGGVLLSGRLVGAATAAGPLSSSLAAASCSCGPPCCFASTSSAPHTAAAASALLSYTRHHRGLATESRSMLGGGAGPATQILGPAAEASLQKLNRSFDRQEVPGAPPVSFLRKTWRFAVRSILVASAAATAASVYYGQYELKDCDAMVVEARQRQHAAEQLATAPPPTRPVSRAPAAHVVPGVAAGKQQAAAAELRDRAAAAPSEPDSGPSVLKQQVEGVLAGAWAEAMEFYLLHRRDVTRRIKEFSDPTYHKLLPDMAPELKGRIKTLVLDLDELLVHKEWTRQKGWLIYKRPGAADFIQELAQQFELVLYTDEPSSWADPVMNKLDPVRMVAYRLFRPETQYHNGAHVRDLSKLNRDMSEVLFLSAKPEAWQFQPENTIKLKPWKNTPNDTMLLDLIPFLQLIAVKHVRDVREVVKAYDGVDDIPRAFRERMKQLNEHQKAPVKRGFLNFGK